VAAIAELGSLDLIMKRLIIVLLAFLAGLAVGWYFGYTRPVTKQYRVLRDTLFHMTDKQMADAGAQIRDHIPEFMERMKRSDDMTTVLALGTYKRLDQGNIDGAKKFLVPWIGGYYRRYHTKGSDEKILASIEEAAQEHPDIAAEVAKKQ
jgi:hypothetical protein